LKLYIYDENSCPSGFAGGHIPSELPDCLANSVIMREFQYSELISVLPVANGTLIKKSLDKVIACSIMVISTGAAFAASVDDKQKEVDQIIFEQHNGDLPEQGFTVTHTAPVNNKVEVGITPYTEASAAYLYDILGED
jgi:hypothetical protein